jgi:invasion protein IalB
MSFATRLARLRGSIGLAALLSLFAATPTLAQSRRPAPAQPAQPAQPAAQPAQPAGTIVQVKAEPSQADWTKVCGKEGNNEICYTTRDFVSDQNQPVLAMAVYDVKGQQAQKVVRFVMPLGLLLQPGLRFAVDQAQAIPGKYVMCLPNGCFAEAQVKDDFINALKKGTNLNVSVQNQIGRELTFAVPAAGFAKAFDGAPIDPKVLEEQQKKLQEELQKKSEEMRKQMLNSGAGAGAGAGATAPSAQAAPKP